MTEEPQVPRPMNDPADEMPTVPTPATGEIPAAPPVWGSAAQGWPPPPAPATTPPLAPPTAPPGSQFGAQAAGPESAAGLPPRPAFSRPTGPAYARNPGPQNPGPQQPGPVSSQQGPGAPYGQAPGTPYAQGGAPYGSPSGGAAPSWNYGYPPASWGPAPAATGPSKATRRVLAAVAIVVLVLASAGVGAAVSAAVNSNSTNTVTAPIGNGSGSGNGSAFGNGSGTGSGTGTGSGLGNGSGLGTGNSSGTNTAPSSAILSKVNPSVVDIYTKISTAGGQGEAAGTGMILTSSGEVLTNNHVIDGATSIRVVIVATGESKNAKVVGYDVVDDVALLQIEDVSGLKPITVAYAEKVAVGDDVVAIGNAGGRGGTPASSAGSVTALDQKVTAGDASSGDSETLHGMIQMSAPIEPGDSGGPLADSDGNVIGMNTAAAQSDDFFGQNGSSTAFAIPINKALDIVHQIEAGKDSDTIHVGLRGILGVQVQNASANNSAPIASGAAIASVQEGGPAEAAGLSGGDVITSIDGKTVTNASDLTALMFTYHPDDKVNVGWVDASGSSHHGSVTLIPGPPT